MPRRNPPRGTGGTGGGIECECSPVVSDHLTKQHYEMCVELRKQVECPVCMDDLLRCKHCYLLLRCGHAMHVTCYVRMLNDRCPVCRQ